jgi:hypothetical protein
MIGNCILAVIMTVTVMTVICIYGMINATLPLSCLKLAIILED